MKKFLFYIFLLALAVTAVFSILGYFGRTNWFLDLFCHFKWQYLIILTIGIIIVFFVRRKLALIFIPFILALSIEIMPLYFGGNKNEDLTETTKIACINLLSSNGQFEDVKNYILQYNPDIVVLQEFTALWQLMLESNLDEYQFRLTIPREDNFGIAIYSKSEISGLEELQLGNAGFPSIAGDIELGGSIVKIISTHPLPPVGTDYFEKRNSQLAELGNLISDIKGEVIVIGDLNTSSFSTHFQTFISNTNLIDTRKGFGILTTWPTWLYLAQTTLDHCLVSQGVYVKSRGVGKDLGSDHLPIYVELGVK